MPSESNQPHRFDRLPATADQRDVADRPTRTGVLEWWADRFAIEPVVFANHTFWERGAGKIWTTSAHASVTSPVDVEGLGMMVLRTGGEHWKPTLEAVQRFGHHADRNVVRLDADQARRFFAGEDQELAWDGDWGYLVATHTLSGTPEPIGVGLYVYGELRSQVPKSRRRTL